jgi:hypothetical protein
MGNGMLTLDGWLKVLSRGPSGAFDSYRQEEAMLVYL